MTGWPITFTWDISLLSAVLLAVVIWMVFRLRHFAKQQQKLAKEVEMLRNEFRAMTSGQLGMGRVIRRMAQAMTNVEAKQMDMEQGSQGATAKTYEQAGLLLARGASIEEVVESCEIAPAEAELLAIIRNSAPSHQADKN